MSKNDSYSLQQQQIPEKDKQKHELELVLGHLVRMRCECQNLQTAIEAEDFMCIMDRVVTFLRYASIILEEKLAEVSP